MICLEKSIRFRTYINVFFLRQFWDSYLRFIDVHLISKYPLYATYFTEIPSEYNCCKRLTPNINTLYRCKNYYLKLGLLHNGHASLIASAIITLDLKSRGNVDIVVIRLESANSLITFK